MNEIIAKWDKASDGRWLVSVRCGGHGSEFVGRAVRVIRKDKTSSHETLGAVVQDYGQGDVCLFEVVS